MPAMSGGEDDLVTVDRALGLFVSTRIIGN